MIKYEKNKGFDNRMHLKQFRQLRKNIPQSRYIEINISKLSNYIQLNKIIDKVCNKLNIKLINAYYCSDYMVLVPEEKSYLLLKHLRAFYNARIYLNKLCKEKAL